MFKISHALTNTRQVTVQEAVYLCLPELWLRKLSPSVLYVNTNIPSKTVRMIKREKEILELPGDSDEIFKSGIVEYYMMRLNQDDLKNICCAVFASYYFKPAKVENDYQPYHKPNENFFPQDYLHHMLMLYYPVFNEGDLKLNNSFLLKFNSPCVLNIVNRNFEPASNIVDHYCVQIQNRSKTEG